MKVARKDIDRDRDRDRDRETKDVDFLLAATHVLGLVLLFGVRVARISEVGLRRVHELLLAQQDLAGEGLVHRRLRV